MSRYIDADKLNIDFYDEYETEDDAYAYAYVSMYQIDTAPSIDIVRCRECRWSKPYSDKQLECDALGLGGLKFPDDFCSYGRRSEKPNNCETCKWEIYCPEMCEGCCEWDSHYEPKDEPQMGRSSE